MNAKLLASLEVAIDAWIEKEFAEGGMPECAYWPDHLVENMAMGAAAVFNANIDGQTFARNA